MGCVPIASVRQSSFDPSQAIAQMAASRQAARVARRTSTSGRTTSGRTSSYRPSTFNEESLYSSVATPEEKSAKESQNRASWNSDRQRQLQQQRNTALPAEVAEILKSAPDVATDQETKESVENYRNSLSQLEDSASRRGGIDPVRRIIDRRKQQLKDQLVKKIKSSKIYQEGKKKFVEWIWRGVGSAGSTADACDAGVADVGIELVGGASISLFQALKTFLLPTVADARPGDPDNGQIMKGLLSFAEPTSLNLKDPATWLVDLPVAAVAFFVLNAVHLMVLAFLTMIGVALIVATGATSLLGEIWSTISSMF